MRIKERICPKRCRVSSAPARQRMLIEVVEEQVTDRRIDLVLNWYCPVCGHNEPMNSKDIRLISRIRKSSGANFDRKKYYPEIKKLTEI